MQTKIERSEFEPKLWAEYQASFKPLSIPPSSFCDFVIDKLWEALNPKKKLEVRTMNGSISTYHEVEPCPFCGEDRHLAICYRNEAYYVRCNLCDMNGPAMAHAPHAVAQWNRRNGK